MVKILFVCLGNICRSPMAEALFRHQVNEQGLESSFLIDSAGTGDWHIGHPPHKGTQQILSENQITFEGLKGRQITQQDLESFDYIIAMDHQNKKDIEALINKGNTHAQILTFMSLLNNTPYKDVPDPYFTGDFDEVYDLINRGTTNLLRFICEKEGIE